MPVKFITLLLLAALSYALFRLAGHTSIATRRASLLLFIAGLVLIEVYLRHNGSQPYFTITTPFENSISRIIPVDSVTDIPVMICDSFGVNRICPDVPNQRHEINKEGFRSLYLFSQPVIDSLHANGKKVILLIGDSYTYGMNADSGYSFANLLEGDKYAIFNAGVPGTDAPQYEAVIKEFVQSGMIKPDKILVCFSGNDLNHLPDRTLTPGIPLIFQANVGPLYSWQGGQEDKVFPSAKSAYQNILRRYTIMGVLGESRLTYILGHSVLVSKLIGLFQQDQEPRVHPPGWIDPVSDHIREMTRICNLHTIPVQFVLLPCKIFVSGKKGAQIEGVQMIDPTLFTLDDFSKGFDDHPNNNGHRKIADELKKLVDWK